MIFLLLFAFFLIIISRSLLMLVLGRKTWAAKKEKMRFNEKATQLGGPTEDNKACREVTSLPRGPGQTGPNHITMQGQWNRTKNHPNHAS